MHSAADGAALCGMSAYALRDCATQQPQWRVLPTTPPRAHARWLSTFGWMTGAGGLTVERCRRRVSRGEDGGGGTVGFRVVGGRAPRGETNKTT